MRYAAYPSADWGSFMPKAKTAQPATRKDPIAASGMGVSIHKDVQAMLDSAKRVTTDTPHRPASVFIVYKGKRPIGATLSLHQHEPHAGGGYVHALHSTWQNGVPITGHANLVKMKREEDEPIRFKRLYAAGDQTAKLAPIPTMIGRSGKKVPATLTGQGSLVAQATHRSDLEGVEPPEMGGTYSIGPKPSPTSNLKRGPFIGTPDEKNQYDAPVNRHIIGRDEKGLPVPNNAATLENQAVLWAMRKHRVPVEDRTWGPEAFHRHVEAMAHTIRTQPEAGPVRNYMDKVANVGKKGDNPGELAMAAADLLQLTKDNPKHDFLNTYRKLVDHADAAKAPKITLPDPQRSIQPSYDTELAHDTDIDEPPMYSPSIKPAIDEPLKLKPIPGEMARKGVEVSGTTPNRLGFMKWLADRGMTDNVAIQNLVKHFFMTPKQAVGVWRRFKSKIKPYGSPRPAPPTQMRRQYA
jgi:hypothetical protein